MRQAVSLRRWLLAGGQLDEKQQQRQPGDFLSFPLAKDLSLWATDLNRCNSNARNKDEMHATKKGPASALHPSDRLSSTLKKDGSFGGRRRFRGAPLFPLPSPSVPKCRRFRSGAVARARPETVP